MKDKKNRLSNDRHFPSRKFNYAANLIDTTSNYKKKKPLYFHDFSLLQAAHNPGRKKDGGRSVSARVCV